MVLAASIKMAGGEGRMFSGWNAAMTGVSMRHFATLGRVTT
jgi:hypothetical protein